MEAKKILIIIYVVAFLGAVFLCSKMISNIKRITPEQIVYFNNESGYIMSEPDEESVELLDLRKGDKLEFLAEIDEWYKVANGPFEGYVNPR